MLSPRLRLIIMFAFLVPSTCVFGNSFLEETKRKASQGDIEAQRTLAYLYGSGKGVSRNDYEAGRWRAAVFNQETKQVKTEPPKPVTNYRSPALPTRPSRGIQPRRPSGAVFATEVVRQRSRKHPIIQTGNVLVSPFKLVFKKSRRALTKLAGRAAVAQATGL